MTSDAARWHQTPVSLPTYTSHEQRLNVLQSVGVRLDSVAVQRC